VSNPEAGRTELVAATIEELADAVRTSRPLDTLVELVIEQVTQVVKASSVAVWLLDRESDLWTIAGGRGLSWRAQQVRFKKDHPLFNRIGDDGEIVVDLARAGFRRVYPEHYLITTALYAPMSIAGKRVGLLALYGRDGIEFTPGDLRFVRTVGAHVGIAISLAALEERAERLAVLEERARLGANLHDGVLQILSSIRLYAKDLTRTLDAGADIEQVRRIAAEIEACVDDGTSEMTDAIHRLRAPDVEVDISQGLELTRRRLQDSGIATELVYEVDELDPNVSDALFWIAREAANNVLRHAKARNVSIELRATGPVTELVISDDGVGMNSDGAEGARDGDGGLGREIMRERASRLGGTLDVRSDKHGTRVFARVPTLVDHG
jgi:nitrate/nitrite-specific signal transduction histidine kinase